MSKLRNFLAAASLLSLGIAAGAYMALNYGSSKKHLYNARYAEQIATIQEYTQSPNDQTAAITKEDSPAHKAKIEFVDSLDKLREIEPKLRNYQFDKDFYMSPRYGDLDGDGRKDVVLFYSPYSKYPGNVKSSLEILSETDSTFERVYYEESGQDNDIVTIDIKDIDNDGKLDIIKRNWYGRNSPTKLSVIKLENGMYDLVDTIDQDGFLGSEDIDNDGTVELLINTSSKTMKQGWYDIFKWNGYKYEKIEKIALNDGSRFTQVIKDPGVPEQYGSSQQNLEQRIDDARSYNDYPSSPYFPQGLTEKHIRLNIILENAFKQSEYSDENRIRNARVHYTISPGSKQDILLRDNPARNLGNSIYRINEDIQLSSNDYARLCLTMEASNFLPIYKCFDSDSMERTQIGDQFEDESSRATFTTIKAKGQNVIGYPDFQGNLEDVTIRIDWPRISDLPRGTFP